MYNDDLIRLLESGRKVIGCFPLYPPLELFDAMGLAPVVLWRFPEPMPETPASDSHLQNYACSVARRLTDFILSDAGGAIDGVFMYNACDTLRNLPEILEHGTRAAGRPLPVHRVHMPMVGCGQEQDVDTAGFIADEFAGLIQALETTYGVVFSAERFEKSIRRFETIRDLCRQLDMAAAQGRIPFADFVRVVHRTWWMSAAAQVDFLTGVLAETREVSPEPVTRKITGRVLLSGILPPPVPVIEAIEGAGLAIAGNDIATLYRAYAKMPAPAADPGRYYHQFYREHFPCPTLLYTADERFDTLLDLIRRRGASGVIFAGEKFCEYEYFEYPYLENRLKAEGIHTLRLEIAMADASISALRTRIEAFAEMVGG